MLQHSKTKFVVCLRLFRLASVLLILMLGATSADLYAQTASPVPITNDPQAVSVINQALTAAGGATALAALQDFKGSGQITYLQPSTVNGTVVVIGTTNGQFRIDATLPTGVLSQAITGGAMSMKLEDGTVVPFNLQTPPCPECIVNPYMLLANAIGNQEYSISYKGNVTSSAGTPCTQVEIQQVIPGLSDPGTDFHEYHTMEFFIDATSYQVLAMQDTIPQHLSRQTQFSNYQTVNGMSLPFTVSQQAGGSTVWTIALSQLTFNTGLLPVNFQF